jgi:hypothetical protein
MKTNYPNALLARRFVRISISWILTFITANAALSAYGGFFSWCKVENAEVGNGIVADTPKVFDDRSLILMMDQLSATLSQMSALDQTKVLQGIGALQGAQQSDAARAFSISTLPLPAMQTTEQFSTNLNQLILQQRVVSNGVFSPSVPTTLGSPLPGFSQSTYSGSAQDVLTEEMNLSYQILNLRLLLERSMSDRI